MKKILALDLGTKTGYALSLGPDHVCSGTWNLSEGRFAGGGMRYLRLRQLLDQTIKAAGGIDALYFEEVRAHKGTDAAHVYGGCLAIVTAYCEEQDPKIPYQGKTVSEIKMHALGKGGGKGTDKPAMLAAAKKKWPNYPFGDDNEVDACFLLDLVKSSE